MYLLDIEGKEYRLRQHWSEITLADSIAIYQAIKEMPDKLRELYLLTSQNKPTDKIKLEMEDTKKHFPLFYGKIIKLLSDIPQEIIDRTDWISRTTVYNYENKGISCKSVVFGLLHFPFDYEFTGRKTFTHEGTEYHLPASKQIGNDIRPMANETAITFTEMADLEIFSEQLQGGKFEAMANIISILCRPEKEKYNENVSLQRVESFKALPMDIVWDVFFSSIQYILGSKKSIPTFSKAGTYKGKRQLLKAV